MNTGFDGADGLIEQIRNLLIIERFQIVETDRFTIAFWQGCNQFFQFLAAFSAFKEYVGLLTLLFLLFKEGSLIKVSGK